MFALNNTDLDSRILGCGDGPSSFNKEVTQKNGYIVSIDPIYQFTREEIILLIEDSIGIINVFKHAINKIFKRK